MKQFLERKFLTIRGQNLRFLSTPPSLTPQGQPTANDAKTSDGPSEGAAGGVAASSEPLEEEKEKEEKEDDGVDRDLTSR